VVRICSRPGGTIEISWLKRFNLAKADPRLGHERRYSGVPPGRGPHVLPDPAINRRATVIYPSGTKNHPKKPLSSCHSGPVQFLADSQPTLPRSRDIRSVPIFAESVADLRSDSERPDPVGFARAPLTFDLSPIFWRGNKSPGYCHMSLRDEEPSQEALIFVPFRRDPLLALLLYLPLPRAILGWRDLGIFPASRRRAHGQSTLLH
jgi:hypothetical protein